VGLPTSKGDGSYPTSSVSIFGGKVTRIPVLLYLFPFAVDRSEENPIVTLSIQRPISPSPVFCSVFFVLFFLVLRGCWASSSPYQAPNSLLAKLGVL